MPTEDLLLASTRLYTGLRDNPDIAAALADFEYDKDDADAGLALVAALRKAIGVQGVEEAEKIDAAGGSFAATAALRAAYTVHRKRARRAHPASTPGYATLNLTGRVAASEAGLFAEARHVYTTLAGAPGLLAPIRNLSERAVADGLALVEAAVAAEDAQTEESGEAQTASAAVQRLRAQLRAEASMLAQDAADALSGQPQLREVLGLLER